MGQGRMTQMGKEGWETEAGKGRTVRQGEGFNG